jgi:hypothetical protein
MPAIIRSNALGDLRAEADARMLQRAFLETPDYRTLIETSDRLLIVGRRGTGKSALTQALERYWRAANAPVVNLRPEEHHIIGVRPLVELFGEKFGRIRAGMRLLWRYTLLMEAALALGQRGAAARSKDLPALEPLIQRWRERGHEIPDRLKGLMTEVLRTDRSPEDRIGDLPRILDLTALEDQLAHACGCARVPVVFLIDRLDEGYEPDAIGVGFVDGLLQAAIDIQTRIPNIRPCLFLRDNIFRAVQSFDPDYSRAIEGHVLRLHWDEQSLLNFATTRIKIAFEVNEDAPYRIWNACVGTDLRGSEGFSKCLRLTLYRPRDVLALLNEGFYKAQRDGHTHLALAHIDGTAQGISQNRLDDLFKEYSAILPGLEQYVMVFRGGNPERTVADVSAGLDEMFLQGSDDPRIQQDLFILEDAKAVLRGLYSVGFLGVRDSPKDRFVFCHDGRAPDREFRVGDSVLVHPCYWMALNCAKTDMDAAQAEDIYDEYDIEVSSETPDIRKRRIETLRAQLEEIPEGTEGDDAFEAWCHKAIRICFAKSLRNVELKPNKLARQRRDVVGTNLGEQGAWKRIREDYGTRQVVFEVKNYKGLSAADYQQIQSYLGGEYGRLAFAVTREDTVDLYANRDVRAGPVS